MDKMGKPVYGITENGMFGVRIVAGIITGVRFTEEEPVYEISFGKNKWWTSEIAEHFWELEEYFMLADLDRVKETHGLKIKYNK